MAFTPVRNVIESTSARLNSLSVASFPSDIGPHQMLFVFKKYAFNPAGSISLNSIQDIDNGNISELAKNMILFPVPSNLLDQNEARLSKFDMNFLGGQLGSAFGTLEGNEKDNASAMKFVDDFRKALTSGNGGEISKMLHNSEFARLSKDAAYLAKYFGTGFYKAYSAGMGVAANPKSALIYDGHEMKNHTFSWTFAPRSEEESTNLRNIINFIKFHQLPSVGGAVSDRLYLNYPSVVDIYFIGLDESYFYKFKPCMLKSFNINYTGQNAVSILRGGRPAVVGVEMNLMEMDIHYAEEYTTIGDTQTTTSGVNNTTGNGA